jgi:hypothetical protein
MEMAVRLILDSPYIIEDISKRSVDARMRKFLAFSNISKILELPYRGYISLTDKSFANDRSASKMEVAICTAIGLAGWTAWTAADNIRDGGKGGKSPSNSIGYDDHNHGDDLYVFSILRPIIQDLIESLSLSSHHMSRIIQIISTMEYANAEHCALGIREWSSWKSMGAAIPFLGLMMKIGATEEDIDHCQSFFYYFISARQLSDDALDWREDIGGCKDSNSGNKVINKVNDTLVTKWMERDFQRRIKYAVAIEMRRRSRQAIEEAQKISCFTDTGFLEELPRYYERMAENIISSQSAHP